MMRPAQENLNEANNSSNESQTEINVTRRGPVNGDDIFIRTISHATGNTTLDSGRDGSVSGLGGHRQ